VSLAVGDRTALVDSGRHLPRRRVGIAWTILAIVVVGGALAGWLLVERARLARRAAGDAWARLGDAHQRAAAAESQLLAVAADRLRPPSAAPTGADLGDLAAVADDLRARLDRAATVVVDADRRRVVVTMDDAGMFRDVDAELTPRGEGLVDAIAEVLARAGDRAVWVHGHVDDTPAPAGARSTSAWERSSTRALAVVGRLGDRGLPARRLAAIAFGAGRPVGSDRAKNRRIEIHVDAAGPAASAMR
jgi:flagellar motor protein MotB